MPRTGSNRTLEVLKAGFGEVLLESRLNRSNRTLEVLKDLQNALNAKLETSSNRTLEVLKDPARERGARHGPAPIGPLRY